MTQTAFSRSIEHGHSLAPVAGDDYCGACLTYAVIDGHGDCPECGAGVAERVDEETLTRARDEQRAGFTG